MAFDNDPHDEERGDITQGDQRMVEANGYNEKVEVDEEYNNLVRYISTYRDGRRLSMQSSTDGDNDQSIERKWYVPWSRPSNEQRKDGEDRSSFKAPEEWLETDIKQGLSQPVVESRRKRTGWNELTTEKENPFLKFLSYFQGPILYGKMRPR